MIVSCINSPFFNLTSFLKDVDKSIKKILVIKNSFDLVKKINDMPLEKDYQIVSFDIYFYTNIPNDLEKCLRKMEFDMQQHDTYLRI